MSIDCLIPGAAMYFVDVTRGPSNEALLMGCEMRPLVFGAIAQQVARTERHWGGSG